MTAEQMEGVIAVVVEEGGSAGFGTVLGKELKSGLHKEEAVLGVVVVADKGTGKEFGLVEEEIGHIEVETVLEWEGIGFDEEKIDAEVDSVFAGVGTMFAGRKVNLDVTKTETVEDETEL